MKIFQRIKRKIMVLLMKRYLLKAVFQILLIMVGVLLAFQINRCKTNRGIKKAERSHIENIRVQLLEDKESISNKMAYNFEHLVQTEYASRLIQGKDFSSMDTLGKILLNITLNSDLDENSEIHETFVSSRDIELLSEQKSVSSIRKQEEKYAFLNRLEKMHFDIAKKDLVPVIKPAIDFSTRKVQNPEMLFSIEFNNSILSLLKVMKAKNENYHELMINSEELIGQIDEVLE